MTVLFFDKKGFVLINIYKDVFNVFLYYWILKGAEKWYCLKNIYLRVHTPTLQIPLCCADHNSFIFFLNYHTFFNVKDAWGGLFFKDVIISQRKWTQSFKIYLSLPIQCSMLKIIKKCLIFLVKYNQNLHTIIFGFFLQLY